MINRALLRSPRFKFSREVSDQGASLFYTHLIKDMRKTHTIVPNELRIALALVGLAVPVGTCELIADVVLGIQEKGGKFDISDASRIEANFDSRQRAKRKVTVKKEDDDG